MGDYGQYRIEARQNIHPLSFRLKIEDACGGQLRERQSANRGGYPATVGFLPGNLDTKESAVIGTDDKTADVEIQSEAIALLGFIQVNPAQGLKVFSFHILGLIAGAIEPQATRTFQVECVARMR